jgi:hypothetical protein
MESEFLHKNYCCRQEGGDGEPYGTKAYLIEEGGRR